MNNGFWGSDEYDRAAQRLYEAGDYDGALSILERGLSLFPDSVELHVSAGYAELAREQYAWARRAYERALAIEPDHEDALVGFGEVLLRFGERSRAFRVFDRVLELGFADDGELLLSIGRALAHERLDSHARRFFEKAVRADRECAEAASELAHVLHRQGEKRRARAWLERALCLDAANHEARTLLANLLYEGGEYARSLAEFERIPVSEMWDPLAVWRVIELLRAYRSLTPDARELGPYLRRLEELSEEPGPEERLLAEIEAGGEWVPPAGGSDQTDLFSTEDREPTGGEPGARPSGVRAAPPPTGTGRREERRRLDGTHVVLGPDGRRYAGDWEAIVQAMCESAGEPGLSVSEYMRRTARSTEDLTGRRIPDDDAEAFLRASAEAGVLRIVP